MDCRAWLMAYLKDAEERGYPQPSDEMMPEVLSLMLQYVGDPDPAMRDELIYSALHQWVLKDAGLDEACLSRLLKTAIDDGHLLHCIGNREDDSVFTRTFSALAVSLALARHRRQPFLTAELFAETKERVLRYYQAERDLRGFVEGRGWAHGAAHGADVLDELALCPECTGAVHLEILEAISVMIRNCRCPLCHNEDDRITNVIFSIHAANLLAGGELEGWAMGLLAAKEEPDDYARYVAVTNARNLVRSVYFRFRKEGCGVDLLDRLAGLESKLHRA